jgi:WD40 repeat protein
LRRDEQIDLDAERYADPHAVRMYTIRNLFEAHPNSPYQDCDPTLRTRIAHQVAAAAGRSFLVARITAGTLAATPHLPNPDDPDWRAGLPRMPSQAMRQDLTRRLGKDADRATDLLRPLAYAEGQGLPWEDVWTAVAGAISGRTYTDDDLDWLRRQAGAYVVEATEAGRSAYRLYHQALAEYLREETDLHGVHAAFTRALLRRVPPTADGDRDWDRAHPYTRRYLATHAAYAGLLDEIVTDTEYLVHADPDTFITHLHTVQTEAAEQAAAVYRASIGGHRHAIPEIRRRILALDAARYNIPTLLIPLNAKAAPHTWKPTFATAGLLSRPARNAVTGHTESVYAVACTMVDGRPVAIIGSRSGTMPIWDLSTRRHVGPPMVGTVGPVYAVACTTVDGQPVAVTGSHGERVRIWDLTRRQQFVSSPADRRGAVSAVACTMVDGRPVAVTGGEDGTVRVWDLSTGRQVGAPLTEGTGPVYAVACTTVDGRPVAIIGSRSGTMPIWDLSTRRHVGPPMVGTVGPVYAVACTTVDGQPVAVTGSRDVMVRIWDLADRRKVGNPRNGHVDLVHTVVCTMLEGRLVAVTGSNDGTVRIWDLSDGQQRGQPMTDPISPVSAVACTQINSQSVAVTGSDDGTVRIWDLSDGQQRGQPMTGHTTPVRAVACTTVNGRPVAVTGADDAAVRMWDLTTGQQIGEPLTGHTSSVTAVACTTLEDRPVAVTGAADATVWIGDLMSRRASNVVQLPSLGFAVAFGDGPHLVCAFGNDFAIFRLNEVSVRTEA